MKVFEFRLEAQDDSGHFRRGTIEAESKEQAKSILLEREEINALYRIEQDELGDLENQEEAHRADLESKGLLTPQTKLLAGRERAQLALHRQEQPYKLVSLSERKDG